MLSELGMERAVDLNRGVLRVCIPVPQKRIDKYVLSAVLTTWALLTNHCPGCIQCFCVVINVIKPVPERRRDAARVHHRAICFFVWCGPLDRHLRSLCLNAVLDLYSLILKVLWCSSLFIIYLCSIDKKLYSEYCRLMEEFNGTVFDSLVMW